MSKRKKKNKKSSHYGSQRSMLDYVALPKLDLDPDTKKGIFIVLILALGAISFLSLFDLAGASGFYLSKGLMLAFGWGKWIAPIILLVLGFFLYNDDNYNIRGSNYLGLFLFIVSFQPLLHLVTPQEEWREMVSVGKGGGYVGLFLISVFFKLLGFWGSLIVAACLLLISLMLMFNTTLASLIGSESWLVRFLYRPITFVLNKVFGQNEHEDDEVIEEDDDAEDDADNDEKDDENEIEYIEDASAGFSEKQVKAEPEFISSAASPDAAKEKKTSHAIWKKSNVKIDLPFSLLEEGRGKPTSGNIKNNIVIIERALENFGIVVEMGEVSVGPTVTQYTFRPSEGIKLSRITNLGNDLALALAAHPIRIEAPIPGRSLVGVEVPNQTKAIVGLKEILLNKKFKERQSNLTIGLGKDVSGRAWLYDLTKMPHLLVAGATNSGKSVCLNSIIVSLLYQNDPDDLRFIMVDPKRVELPVYNGIPHLLTPVITEVSKTINALRWCLNEMDRRFEVLSKSGKRNIASYNSILKNSEDKMPYIVFIVDELADLMVVAARDIEAGVIRLAQMARAVGIHLVLATQRPSVDVITGLIKANMPARIAFSVASGVDSRTILDSLGAEKLLGRGDMFFITAELSKPKRIQGAFVSDNEIKRIIRYIKERSKGPDYVSDIVERQKVHGMAGVGIDGGGDDDELLEEAKELIINSGKASASFLQRRLSVGYARAARLLDLLEEAGVVGPSNGAKPREILISAEQYESMASDGVSGVNLHDRDEAEAPDEYLDAEQDAEDVDGNEAKEDIKEDGEEEADDDEDEDGKFFSR